jgi:hypothetical protein
MLVDVVVVVVVVWHNIMRNQWGMRCPSCWPIGLPAFSTALHSC